MRVDRIRASFALLPIAVLVASCSFGNTPPEVEVEVVQFDPPGPKDPELALRAAVFLGSCMSEGKDSLAPQNVIDEMYYMQQRSFPYTTVMEQTTQCFASKTNGCKAVQDCFGSYLISLVEPCQTVCFGTNVYQLCVYEDSHPQALIIDCNRLGMSCTFEGCSPFPEPGACDPATFELCKSDKADNCSYAYKSVLRGFNCSELGLECGVLPLDGIMRAVCRGEGAACDTKDLEGGPLRIGDAEMSCQGTEAHTCVNRAEHVYDCGSVGKGFSCQSFEKEVFCGLGSECNPGGTLDTTCDGDKIVVCNAGRIDRVDCKSLGFDGCDPASGICFPRGLMKD